MRIVAILAGLSHGRRGRQLAIILTLLVTSCFLKDSQATSDEMGVSYDKAIVRSTSPSDKSDVGAGDLYALVVGVSKYSHNPKISNLNYSDKDAEDFSDFLKSQKALYRKLHITLLLNEKATKEEVEKNLYYELPRAGKNDTIVIFLSGHGAEDPKMPGEFFFLTYDADPDYLATRAVHMNRQWFLSKLQPKRVVIIVDACHSGGGIPPGFKAVAGSSIKLEMISRNRKDVSLLLPQERTRSRERSPICKTVSLLTTSLKDSRARPVRISQGW